MTSEDLVYAEKDGIVKEFSIGVWENFPDDKYGYELVKTEMPESVKAAIEPKQPKEVKAAKEPKQPKEVKEEIEAKEPIA